MRNWMLAAGAAALAVTAPALAERGGNQGKGKSSQAERGGGDRGKARAARGGGDRERGNRAERARGGDDNRRAVRAARAEDRGDRKRANRAARTQGNDDNRRAIRAARADDRGDRNRGRGNDRDRVLRVDRGDNIRERIRNRANLRFAEGDRVFRVREMDRGTVRFRDVDRDDLFVRRLGFGADGCPPGLAKKPIACMPPGQAAKFVGQPLMAASRIGALAPLPRSLRDLYFDDDDYYYRYGGGYLYRVDRDDDLISSLIPLFGAALLGQQLQPSYLNPYQPSYFSAFYPNSRYDCYRNGFGYVYETDCATGLIEDVIPTYGYGYGVGQMLPASYGYYNLPYAYRGYYPDNDDHYYRYAPGAIYQVDRSTSLISAVAALLTGGLSVGQPLPAGYSAYNVPYAYRTTYYDTPDMWYRYNNGYIYSVDPTTQLVTAIVRALV